LNPQPDITYQSGSGRFNYRVAGVIVHDGRVLVMSDERLPYYYLPGGRVRLHESSQEALEREVAEELGVPLAVGDLLWVHENFFVEAVTRERYHEVCFYYQLRLFGEIPWAGVDEFSREEGTLTHHFRWMALGDLNAHTVFPTFLADRLGAPGDGPVHVVERR